MKSASNLHLLLGSVALSLSPLQAADFVWDGSIDTWESLHWNAGVPGPTAAADTATINSGTVNFSKHDTFGNASTPSTPAITLNPGGTLSNGTAGWFNTLWDLNMNGGTLYANGGHSSWGAFGLAGTVTVGGSTASTISGNGTANARIDVRNNGTNFAVADVTGDASADLTISATLANGGGSPWNAGSLVKSGAGTLVSSGANTFTGSTTINAGTLQISGGSSLADGAALILADVAGANLVLGNNETVGSLAGGGATGGNVNLGTNTLTAGNSSHTTFGGALSGTGGALVKQGSGSLTLSGANTYTGGTSVNAGTLNWQNTAAKPATGTTTVAAGATLALGVGGAGGFSTADVDSLYAGTLTGVTNDPASGVGIDTTAGNATYASALGTLTKGLTKLGDNTLNLGGTNTLSGDVFVLGGTLDVADTVTMTNVTRLNTKNGGAMVISGPVTLADNASFGVGAGVQGTTGSVTVNTGGELNIGAGGAFTGIGGGDLFAERTQSGNGTLTIAGGTLNVAAPGTNTSGAGGLDATRFWMNPYGAGTGVSTINLDGGLLSTAREIRDGSGGTTIFNFNGGTLQAAAATAGSLLGNMDRVNVRDGGGTIDTQALTITYSQNLLHSNIGGDNAIDGGLTKTGSGILSLNGANTFNGDLVINEGTLINTRQVNNANPTATGIGNMTTAGRKVTVNSGASLLFNASDAIGSYQYKTPVVLVADGGTIATNNNNFMSIGDVELKNGGTLRTTDRTSATVQSFNLRGTISVSGTSGSFISSTVSAGTLFVTTNNGIHLGGATIAATTFDIGVTGDPTADLTVSVPLLNETNQTTGGLIKDGAGMMVLSATSTYTGDTTVSAGTLFVTGALGATDTTVASGAAIGGGGLIDGSLTFELGANLVFSSTDTLTVNGTTVSFGGFNITNLFGLDSSVDEGTYTLIDGSASFDLANVSNLGLANAADIGGGKSAYFESGSLNLVVIPEPGVALLGGFGLLALLRRRRG